MVRMFQPYAIGYQPYASMARLASEIFFSGLPTVVLLLLACSETENVNLEAKKITSDLVHDAS
jgi:hypothetical protein